MMLVILFGTLAIIVGIFKLLVSLHQYIVWLLELRRKLTDGGRPPILGIENQDSDQVITSTHVPTQDYVHYHDFSLNQDEGLDSISIDTYVTCKLSTSSM